MDWAKWNQCVTIILQNILQNKCEKRQALLIFVFWKTTALRRNKTKLTADTSLADWELLDGWQSKFLQKRGGRRGNGSTIGRKGVAERNLLSTIMVLFSQYFHRHHYKHRNMQLATLAEVFGIKQGLLNKFTFLLSYSFLHTRVQHIDTDVNESFLRLNWCYSGWWRCYLETDDTNRAYPGNMTMQLAPHSGQLCNWCKGAT